MRTHGNTSNAGLSVYIHNDCHIHTKIERAIDAITHTSTVLDTGIGIVVDGVSA